MLKWIALVAVAFFVLPPIAHAGSTKHSATEVKSFLSADLNADRHLDRSEFRTFVHGMAASGNRKAKQIRMFRAYGFAFSVIDNDKNGLLSPSELRTADTAN